MTFIVPLLHAVFISWVRFKNEILFLICTIYSRWFFMPWDKILSFSRNLVSCVKFRKRTESKMLIRGAKVIILTLRIFVPLHKVVACLGRLIWSTFSSRSGTGEIALYNRPKQIQLFYVKGKIIQNCLNKMPLFLATFLANVAVTIMKKKNASNKPLTKSMQLFVFVQQ